MREKGLPQKVVLKELQSRLREDPTYNSGKILGSMCARVKQNTLLGTRSGPSAVTVWVLLKHLGRKGYKTVEKHCMELTQKLLEGVQRIDGINLVTQPKMNIVGIKSDVVEIRLIARELRSKGWAISPFPNHIRIVVMPHVKLLHIEIFFRDLEIFVEKLSG